MTLDDLIERLTETREALGGDVEVRLMTQPNWPFENGIAGITTSEEMNQDEGDEDEEGNEADADAELVVYICEGEQIGYGSKSAWDVCC